MGNDTPKNKCMKEIIDYIKSDNFPKKEIPNRFLQRNVKISDLTSEELEILKCLSKPEKAYYCGYCPGFPLLIFTSTQKKSIGLYLLEHNWKKEKNNTYFSHSFKDKELEQSLCIYDRGYIERYKINDIIKDKYIKNTSDDLLPFESLDDFHEYLKVVIKYKALKEQIAYYNLGNTKKNSAFTFFEFLLNIGLYGFGTLYEYLNALSIFDVLTFEAIEYLNCGEHMKNGDLINYFVELRLKQVINVKPLNDNYLLAYIIDTNYKFSSNKECNCGIFLDHLDITINAFNYLLLYLNYTERDPPYKNRIAKYENYNYKDIIELDKDKYLLQVDNNYVKPNLIIAEIIENTNKYNYKLFSNIICLSFLKLKSNQIFFVNKSNFSLMEYDGYDFKILKKFNYLIKVGKYNYCSYELLNGDIIFNISPNKICYFNMKTFSIQTIIEKEPNKIINKFNQLNDKNYFYFFHGNVCYEFNIRNGKIKRVDILKKNIENYTPLGEYYIDHQSNFLIIFTDDNERIYSKSLHQKINDIFIIDKKEKIFASLAFYEPSYLMYVSFFKITKLDCKKINT